MENNSDAAIWIFGLSLFMAIWATAVHFYLQFVHYPLYERIGRAEFAGYATMHRNSMNAVVSAPSMLGTLLIVIQPFIKPPFMADTSAWINLVLVLIATVASFVLIKPYVAKLDRDGFDAATLGNLRRMNLVRSIAWGIIAVNLTWEAIEALLGKGPQVQ